MAKTFAADVLKFKDAGPSVEEAREQMFKAGEAPVGSAGRPPAVSAPPSVPPDAPAAVDVLEPVLPDEVPPKVKAEPEAKAPVELKETKPPEPKVEQVPERVETDQFTGEIRQEKGGWIAELKYKSGAGVERFVAATKNELMLALLKGKGHATMRVKQAVRREKLGRDLDTGYPLPSNLTAEEFEKLPDKQRELILDGVAREQCYEFRELHPEVKTPANGEAIIKFLRENSLPITIRNMEYALEDLQESGLIEVAPPAEAAEPEKKIETSLATPVAAPEKKDSSPVATSPPAEPSVPPAEASAPPVTVRKRGSSGLQPGQSSAPSALSGPEGGEKPKELSEAELRKLPLSELKRIATADRAERARAQR